MVQSGPLIAAAAIAGAALGLFFVRMRMPRRGDLLAPPPVVALSRQRLAEVRALVELGKKIEAIALVRSESGVGLKEAKDYVDGLGR